MLGHYRKGEDEEKALLPSAALAVTSSSFSSAQPGKRQSSAVSRLSVRVAHSRRCFCFLTLLSSPVLLQPSALSRQLQLTAIRLHAMLRPVLRGIASHPRLSALLLLSPPCC